MSTPTLDPAFSSALRRELVNVVAAPRRPGRRWAAILTGLTVSLGVSGVAVATLRPAADVVTRPLATPILVNGVGSIDVPLPSAPAGATYVRVELACFDAFRCLTDGGGVTGPATSAAQWRSAEINLVARSALPLTSATDPRNAQRLPVLDPARGVPVEVSPGAHWRLYAVYTNTIDPSRAPLPDTLQKTQRSIGIPGLELTDMVPVNMTNGELGYVSYDDLLLRSKPGLTSTGTQQEPLPAYAVDGTTRIGHADVDEPYRR